MTSLAVLLTRPADQLDGTTRRLAALGHRPLACPIAAIVAVPSDPPPGPPPDALIVTSVNAVPALAERPGATGWRDLPVFAVGDATAAALRVAGARDVRIGPGDAAGLAGRVAAELPPRSRLLHVGARDRRPEPEASLAALGFPFRVWEVYAAEPLRALPDPIRVALEAGTLDAALHYSRRSAGALIDLAVASGLGDAFASLQHLCLSAEIASAFLALPGARIAVSDRPREADLLRLLGGLRPGDGSRIAVRP